jgi:ribonuclease HI
MQEKEKLVVFTDGGARGNPGPSGVGIYITNSSQEEIWRQCRFLGNKTNNEAEYIAFQIALEYLLDFLKNNSDKYDLILFKLDSKLVVEQLNRNWQIKEPRLKTLAETIWQSLSSLPCSFLITHIPREQNKVADALANEAMDNPSVFV